MGVTANRQPSADTTLCLGISRFYGTVVVDIASVD